MLIFMSRLIVCAIKMKRMCVCVGGGGGGGASFYTRNRILSMLYPNYVIQCSPFITHRGSYTRDHFILNLPKARLASLINFI